MITKICGRIVFLTALITGPSFGFDGTGPNQISAFLNSFATVPQMQATSHAWIGTEADAGKQSPLTVIDGVLGDTLSGLRLPDLSPSFVVGLDPVQATQSALQEQLLDLPQGSVPPKARFGISTHVGQSEFFTGWSLTDPKTTRFEDSTPEMTLRLRF